MSFAERVFDFTKEPDRDLEGLASRLGELGCIVEVDDNARILRVVASKCDAVGLESNLKSTLVGRRPMTGTAYLSNASKDTDGDAYRFGGSHLLPASRSTS